MKSIWQSRLKVEWIEPCAEYLLKAWFEETMTEDDSDELP